MVIINLAILILNSWCTYGMTAFDWTSSRKATERLTVDSVYLEHFSLGMALSNEGMFYLRVKWGSNYPISR